MSELSCVNQATQLLTAISDCNGIGYDSRRDPDSVVKDPDERGSTRIVEETALMTASSRLISNTEMIRL